MELCWYSVSERLPQEGEKVLVYDSKEGIVKTCFTWEPYETEDGGFDKYGFAIWDKDLLNITHWMPLPPAPEITEN